MFFTDEVQDSAGYKKAKAMADEIKKEKEEKVMKEEKTLQSVRSQLAIRAANLPEEARAYMQKHVADGVEDLNTGMSIPQLRIHSAGISTKNQLPDGSDPRDGQVYYTGSQEAFDKVVVILLALKKCRLEQKNEATGETRMQATYLLAGVINDDGRPFVMYVKGMSYNKIWGLEEQLQPYVTKREGGIPLSMLKVVVSSTKERVEKGKYKGQMKNVFKFDLLLDAQGEFPILETNPEVLKKLEGYSQRASDMLMSIISQKGVTEKEYIAKEKAQVVQEDETEIPSAQDVTIVQDVSDQVENDNEDLPF